MSIFSLTPWFLSSIIIAVIFSMIVGMIITNERKAAIAFLMIIGISFGCIINWGIDYNAYQFEKEIEAESHLICLKAEKTHLIYKLNEIKKIQIKNHSSHINYTQDYIDDLENTGEFLLSTNIEASKDAIDYINNNPWLLK